MGLVDPSFMAPVARPKPSTDFLVSAQRSPIEISPLGPSQTLLEVDVAATPKDPKSRRRFPQISRSALYTGFLGTFQGVMMSFLGDGISLAPLTGKEILGIGVKEEFSEDVAEDTCLDMKEEPLDYGDETRNGVCNVNVLHGSHFFHNLHDLRPEAHAKDSCNLVQDGNDMSKNLLRYMRTHTKEKPYSCEICNKAFSYKSSLEIHMRRHRKEKTYSCEICNKAFYLKSHVVRHMRVHTKEKPYSCEICNKAFSYRASQVSHMRLHTQEKPYSCEICNKHFSNISNQIQHMRVHMKEKPYSCNLEKHMRVHTKDKPMSQMHLTY
ncbi:zinc finger protein 79-like [Penaeus monodon]|uniref:zinc finger protein 79-like n=1 Tax=Penaeus monodon TaxID=6687 RepID=UPI0018A75E7C|nr:zinc finger protein 79-like [Penaeus monodon]